MKRRDFIKITAIGAPLSLPFLFGGCATTPARDPAQQRGKPRHPTDPTPGPGPAPKPGKSGTRPSVTSAEAIPHLKSYAKAIAAMRQLPDSDGRSWYQQSQVHNNHCWHNSWFFFPWHRDYLHRFQEIIRQQSGDDSFMLPYWDWTDSSEIPTQFRDVTDATFGQLACSSKTWDQKADPSRTAANLASIATQIKGVTNSTKLSAIMAATDFPTFMGGDGAAGGTEGGPHNGVHSVIGSFGGPMGDFTSPLDPIFWLHHCNVDRIWAAWQENPDWKLVAKIAPVEDGGKKGSDWLAQKLEGFFDLSGKEASDVHTPADMLDTTADNLGYEYASLKIASAGAHEIGRGLAATAEKPKRVVAFTERSIVEKSDWQNGSTSALLTLRDLAKGSRTAALVGAYLGASGNPPNNLFRLKVSGLPRLVVDPSISAGAGPLMSVTVKAHGKDIPQGDFCFFVPMHPAGSAHASHSMTLPAAHFDFTQVLDALKKAGFNKYPSPLSLEVAFIHPGTGAAFAVDPQSFASVDIKLVVVG